jgi:hypothetical protein
MSSILVRFRDLTPRERVDLIEQLPPEARHQLEKIAHRATSHLAWVPNPHGHAAEKHTRQEAVGVVGQ